MALTKVTYSMIHGAVVNVLDFGAVSGANSTTALQAAFNYAKTNKIPLYIPAGTYEYSALTGWSGNNVTVFGDGSNCTVLKFTGTGVALEIGAAGTGTADFNISGLTIEGNANVSHIIKATQVNQSQWSDIQVREGNPTTGVGFGLYGCVLNKFEFLCCAAEKNAMVNVPAYGMELAAGGGINSSDNTFLNLTIEGWGALSGKPSIMLYGLAITNSDQNTFINGTVEGVATKGISIGSICRYNTFINVGLENTNSADGDVFDGGIYNKWINCYSSERFLFDSAQDGLVEGGYFERMEIAAGSIRCRIKGIRINHWASGSGGLYDNGTGTETSNIYDVDTSAYLTDIYPRFLLYRTGNLTNVTGDGTAYTMTWDDAVYDDNKNCDAQYFTAPVTSRYQLNATISLTNLSTAATSVSLQIVTTSRTYTTTQGVTLPAGALQTTVSLSAQADMTAGNGAYVIVKVSGMAGKTATVQGGAATTIYSSFSGHKIH